MAKPKKVDPIKQREKRAKIAAAVGGVLLLGVAAFEIPSMMGALNKKPPPGANATDAGNRNPDGSIPLPNVSTISGITSSGQLADTDVPPPSADGQLVSFSVFQTKNPFIPQVSNTDTPDQPTATPPAGAGKGGADVPPATTTPTAPAPTPTPTATPTTTTGMLPPTATTPAVTTPTVAPPPTVTISVNGTVSHVAAQGTFPSGAPVFRLVSFAADTAEVAIVGGSYATGDSTLTLHVGRPVTLENQTDGKRYTLELVSTR